MRGKECLDAVSKLSADYNKALPVEGFSPN